MITHKVLNDFIEKALINLKGEWIIIGGTVLPLLNINHRTTVDIDLISCNPRDGNETLIDLMTLAEKCQLPPEVINQAGAYFLNKINDWKNHLVVVKKTKTITLYRPDINLFIRLKISRLSESDLSDCLEFLKLTPTLPESLDLRMIKKEIKREILLTENIEKMGRLKKLLQALLKP